MAEGNEQQEQLLAQHHVLDPLIRLMANISKISEDRPNALGQTADTMRRALDIAAKAYRRGGCTSGQLQALEDMINSIKGLAR